MKPETTIKIGGNLANVLITLFICAMLFGIIAAIASCDTRTTEANERTIQMRTDLEKCVRLCPSGWTVDKDCANRCMDLEEIRLED